MAYREILILISNIFLNMSLVKILRWLWRESLLLGSDLSSASLVSCLHIFCWKPHTVVVLQAHAGGHFLPAESLFLLCSLACSMFHLVSLLRLCCYHGCLHCSPRYLQSAICYSSPFWALYVEEIERAFFPYHLKTKKCYWMRAGLIRHPSPGK